MGLCLSLALIAGWLPAPEVEAATTVSVIDWKDEKQVMDGLGGAYAFNKADGIKQIYDEDPVRGRELLDLMFSDEKGIGLEIVRVIIGDGGIINPETKAEWGNRFYDGPSDSIWPEKDGGFVWDQPDWESKKADFDSAQVWIMKEAMAYGVETFYANAWTPPYWMKTNNSVLGQNGAKLRPEHYQNYADYLVQYALGYKREFGIPITHIGPANESEAAHASYSGFVITAAEYKDFMQNYLGPTLKKTIDEGAFAALNVDPPKIVAPEGTNLGASVNFFRSMLEDPASSQYIDVFSTHLYGTSSFNNGPMTSTGTGGNYPEFLRNFTLWQTEYMTQNSNSSANVNTQTYANQTITDGVYWGNLLTHMFTSDPAFSAFIWWWPMANNGSDGSDLIRLAHTGSPQGNGSTVTGEYRVFKRFYTFGNFSRFVKPNDVRIGATRVPVTGTNITAYKNPVNNEFSIVAVNSGATEQEITFQLNDFPAGTKAVVGYRTTASENQKRLDPIEIVEGAFTAKLPSNSVITFVPEKENNLPGLNHMRDIFSTLEAEDHDGASAEFSTVPRGEGSALSGVGNGDYIRFANVNFADGSANGGIVRRHILGMNAILASLNGGIIEVRVDDPKTGKIVGTFTVPGNRNGEQYQAYSIQVDTGDNAAYGIRDVYMVFRGKDNALFNIDRFEFNQTVHPSASLLVNGSFEAVPGTSWERAYGTSGTTLERTNVQNYSAPVTAANQTTAYSISIANREEPVNGASQVITGKLTPGAKYKVNGFFMPTTKDAKGTIQLVALDADGKVVSTTTVAERSNLEAMRWSQVDAIFTYEAPAVDFATLKIVFSDSETSTLYLDEVALVPYVDKAELITLLSKTPVRENYSEEEWRALLLLIDEGWVLAASPEATQATVDAKAASLLEAFVPDAHAGTALTGPATVTAGDAFDLTYGLAHYEGSALALDTTVTYDHHKLEFVAPVSLDDELLVVDYDDEQPGVIRILNVFLGERQTAPEGELMKLQFKAKRDATSGDVQITASDVLLADSDAVELAIAGASHSLHVVAIQKETLAALIEEAQELHDSATEGRLVGQYPVGSKATLQAAIDKAIAIADNPSSSQAQLNQAATELRQAVDTFKALVIIHIPGDFNQDNRISVGDLALVAKSYGKTSADPDWDAVKTSDLNNDGVIDIVDLVLVARMIFDWQE